MNSTRCRILALLPVAAFALTLTLLFSGGDNVRAMLQVSTLDTPTPFVPTPVQGTPGLPAHETVTPETGQPTPEILPSLEPPTPVPLPVEAGPTPTPWGFLPAPTIVNPSEIKSLPIAQPPVWSGGSSAEPTSIPTRAPAGNSMVRAAVELLNYLWLLCGGLILVAGAVAILSVWRRSRRS